MAGCCPGSGGSAIVQAKRELDGIGDNGNMNTQIDPDAEMVRLEYYGPRVGAVTYHGKRKKYRFGNNAVDRFDDVNPEDVETLLGQPNFRIIDRDAHKHKSSGADFVPEPSGEVVQEVVIPEPAGEVVTLESASVWEDEGVYAGETLEDGDPPALDIESLPGTVKEIKKAVMGADLDTLLAWLKEEQRDKQRKTALEAIENALEDRYP